jgi:hypothetical protein
MALKKISSHEHSIHYPIGRNPWGYLGIVIGALFVGIGVSIPDLIFNILFPLLGGLAFLGGVYQVANSLDVSISKNGIYTDRFIFGFRSKRHVLPLTDFKCFEQKKSHSTSTGSSTTQYYNIVATGLHVKDFVVAENLHGRGQIKAAIERLQQLINEVSS